MTNLIGCIFTRRRDGFVGKVISVSAWSKNYYLVENATGERVLATSVELADRSRWEFPLEEPSERDLFEQEEES